MQLTVEETRAYVALLEVSTLLFGQVSRHLRNAGGITHAQFEILVRLAGAPDGLRMSDLAASLVVSQSGLTYQASQLEEMGLLSRGRLEADERVVVARITPKGAALIEGLLPGHVELVRTAFFSQLRAGELETLTDILERLSQHLRQGGRSGAEP